MCQYVFKNGNLCKNKAIGDIDRCHIMSHQNDMVLYQKTVKNLKNKFLSSTIDINNFIVYDVPRDGACVYHCMNMALQMSKNNIKVNYDSDYMDQLLVLVDKKNVDDDRELMAYLIQQIIREWIMENQDREIEGMSLKDYVCLCHDLYDIDEYNEHYKNYAGEEHYIYIDKVNGKKQKEYLKDRWGGSPEFYAFTIMFGFELDIYSLKRFSEKNCKIIKGSLKNDVSRLEHLQTFNKGGGKPIRFLQTDNNGYHYSYLQLR